MTSFLDSSNPFNAYNTQMYRDALDFAECEKQMHFLTDSSMILPFIDASAKMPSGILKLNHIEYGDYFECLNINNQAEDMHIQGKYCFLSVPSIQNLTMPLLYKLMKMPNFSIADLTNSEGFVSDLMETIEIKDTSLISVRLGMCIPKVCTLKQVGDYISSLVRMPKVEYIEGACRLPGDKMFTTSDYVAFGVFGMLFLLTFLSTSFDLYNTFIKKSRSKHYLLSSLSLYTNTKRLLNFESSQSTINCVDGIRSLSMLWVIYGHTYVFQILSPAHNILDLMQWTMLFTSTWINTAPMVVDTFFMLSGLFCVYALPSKMSPLRFLKSIHIFYSYRILRMIPILGTAVLLQASIFHWITDGPDWDRMAYCVEACRTRWWATMLHIQNYIRPAGVCLLQSWYLTVDTQLYFVSPLVIIFLLVSSTAAWCALTITFIASLATLGYYTAYYEYPSVLNGLWQSQNFADYYINFYMNTPIRASPFIVGMMFGYILWVHKEKELQLSKKFVTICWTISFVALAYLYLTIYMMVQLPYKFTYYDLFFNIVMRAIWAAVVGWIVLACRLGYGGVLNWFLSLQMWKLPSRVSYGVYMIHLQVILISTSGAVQPRYFTEINSMYYASNYILISLICGCILSVMVDSPASTLLKILFGKKSRRSRTRDDCVEETDEFKTKL
ncbi:nose resistant to fluoxetine protein 6-like [Pieris brassicae]|uniref:nose resistant to fluoxetine protein 6-like n=1 Tax=Pieris brassicae TaxID=7116 RepID=UPI001E660B36|nr:nose resistant to fluoxetine protein 6-like [Pieris brassicae]